MIFCYNREEYEFERMTDRGENIMNVNDIKQIIPHRYPFLLVDKIIEMEEGKRVVGIKNVTINEPFFQGHFPDYPVMPGVLILEALAQVGAVAVLNMEENKHHFLQPGVKVLQSV